MSEGAGLWVDQICSGLPEGAFIAKECFRDQYSLVIDASKLLKVMHSLRDDWGFRYLIDVTAVDLFPATPRFQLVYHLWSHKDRRLLRIKVPILREPPAIASVAGIWSTANWHEREVYDMFGIEFLGHPDLRRILTPEGWQGYPLRKDYPVEGPPEIQNWIPPRIKQQVS